MTKMDHWDTGFGIFETSFVEGIAGFAVIIGVEMFLLALLISFKRGTPSVTFIEETPAK